MKIRSFQSEDVERVDEIWREFHDHDFSVPNRNSTVVDAVVEDDSGRVIAYGQVRLFAELMMILDLGASRRDKVAAIKLLMQEAFRGAQVAKIEDVYAFIKDPAFAALIEKHFCFDRIDSPGEMLVRRLD